MGTYKGRNDTPVDVDFDYDARVVWERLPMENSKPYAAFCIYRDLLTDDRSIIEAYRIYTNDSTKPYAMAYFLAWARRFRWKERALAYDDYKEAKRRKAKERDIDAAAKQHVKQVRNYNAVLNSVEKVLMERLQKNPELSGVRDTDLINAVIRGAAIVPKLQEAEMAALGKPKTVEVTGPEGGPILMRYIPPEIVGAGTPEETAEPHADEVQ